MALFSVIEIEHHRFKGRDSNDKSILAWEKELNFYMGDLSSIDVITDWRTKEVKDKRRTGVFLGLITNPPFPITYPLQLDNGHICEDVYAKVDSNEPDYNSTI